MTIFNCKQCGTEKISKTEGKGYCSLPCYLASDEFKINQQKAHAATRARGNKVICPNSKCGKEFHLPPSRVKRNPYRCCSKSCQREYFAERFDRFIASPVDFQEMQQAYDEFLSQERLPCLVDGCTWTGKNLSSHMNQAHGVTAAQFKALCGFNVKTGVICTEYARHLSEQGTAHLPKDGSPFKRRGSNKGFKFRAEGMEHYMKARAGAKAEA